MHAVHTAGRYHIWASGTRAWTDTPRRVQVSGTDVEQLAKETVQRLNAPVKPLRVVITRALEGDELIARTLVAHGIAVSGAELLTPAAIPFAELPDHDRIFFTSRNAVRFFVKGGGDLRMAPCDAIGNGTAEEIRKHGAEANFIGDGPDTPTIAKDYVERFGQVSVLFPCVTDGLRTIQKAMPEPLPGGVLMRASKRPVCQLCRPRVSTRPERYRPGPLRMVDRTRRPSRKETWLSAK